MKILYIGTEDHGFVIQETFPEAQIKCSGYAGHISQVTDMATEEIFDILVIEIDMFIDDAEQIAEGIETLANVSHAKTIIYAPNYLPESTIIQNLISRNFTYFCLSPVLSKQKEELTAAIAGKSLSIENLTINEEIFSKKNVSDEIHKNQSQNDISNTGSKSIAFVGVCPRIGTTTQAIQTALHLMLQGEKVCYLELNSTRFVRTLSSVYKEAKEQNGVVIYKNINLLPADQPPERIRNSEFDYYIYDYGSYDNNFNSMSFFDKDKKIVVCGSKPAEFIATTRILRNVLYSDIEYIFSFCHQTEQKDILELMDSRAKNTHFADYTPDMFFYSSKSNPLYQEIFQSGLSDPKRKSGFSIFKRTKK